MLDQQAILYPTFALVVLTFAVALRLGQLRFAAVKRGDVNPRYYELNRGGKLPDYLIKVSQNYDNLLELPILFYALVALLLASGQVELTQVILAWVFVALRYLHSYIHITSNNLKHRMRAFLLGGVVLMVMWAVFLFQVV